MEERRQEIRTILDSMPDSMKKVEIKPDGMKNCPAVTVDISSIGMAFMTTGKPERNLEIGSQVVIHFNEPNYTLKANVVYSYPVLDSYSRIGVLFKKDNAIKQFYKMLDKAMEMINSGKNK